MRLKALAAAAMATVLWLGGTARADETTKLTYLTFNKPVQLPGVTLPAGRYRFELADPQESRRVVKVASEDGKQQYAMLLSLQNQLNEPAKDPVVLFAETPEGQPDAVKAWVYPGERIGYEFVYPHDQAMKIAKQSHGSVLSKSGETIERIDEHGNKVQDSGK